MVLHYEGSIRRVSGYGMAFAKFENDVELTEGYETTTAVPDSKIHIYEVKDGVVEFSFIYFDKETRFRIEGSQEIFHKAEGNAAGYEIKFSLK